MIGDHHELHAPAIDRINIGLTTSVAKIARSQESNSEIDRFPAAESGRL
jgi:hypothetical protein